MHGKQETYGHMSEWPDLTTFSCQCVFWRGVSLHDKMPRHAACRSTCRGPSCCEATGTAERTLKTAATASLEASFRDECSATVMISCPSKQDARQRPGNSAAGAPAARVTSREGCADCPTASRGAGTPCTVHSGGRAGGTPCSCRSAAGRFRHSATRAAHTRHRRLHRRAGRTTQQARAR